MDAYEILAMAVKMHKDANGGKIDISAIAKRSGLTYPQAYYPLVGQRKPNATIWMKLMAALGHKISIGDMDDIDRLRGGIVQGI